MKNPNNQVTVKYPNGQVRVRNCQTTVVPTADEIGYVNTFDDWQIYLVYTTDKLFHAFERFDAVIMQEELAAIAKFEILNPRQLEN